MTSYGIHYATSKLDSDFPVQTNLLAGDTPALTSRDVALPAGAFVQYEALTTGYAKWTGSGPIIAITAFPIGSSDPRRKSVYTAGMFNIDAIAWPSGVTEAQVQTASENSQCQFRKPLYSDKRTGNEIMGVTAGPSADELALGIAPGTLASKASTVALSGQSFAMAGATNPTVYKVEAGALPTGTSLNTSTGAWTGTPSTPGTFTFTISARDSAGKYASGQYTQAIT